MSYPLLRSGRLYLFTKPSRSDMAILITAGVIMVLLWVVGIGAFSLGVYAVTFVTSAVVALAIAFDTTLRTKAWLEGTTLTVRGAYTTHRRDLARAAVRLDTDPSSGMPLLTAQDAAGRPVRLVLREQRRREALEPQKLHALADAIMAGGRQDEAGYEVASGRSGVTKSPWTRIFRQARPLAARRGGVQPTEV